MSPSSALPMAAPPKCALGRYRLLSPTAGIRVSPLCLGTMSFGTAWKDHMQYCDQQAAEEVLDYFYDHGGNFIDTSNNYQFEESETWIGEWMKKRGNRDQMVIATKYSTNYMANKGAHVMANYAGNSTKSLRLSVEASLRKLQTSYIDVLYVHWWDFSTSVPEMMQSLNTLVAAGQVLYLGVSDAPAWVVSKANQYARDHALRQFSVYQGRWSAAVRDVEREILPMCRDEGMAITAWGALGGGKFRSDDRRTDNTAEAQACVGRALATIARRKSTLVTQVALAYVMHKAPYVFPVVTGRSNQWLRDDIEALSLELAPDEMKEIEAATQFDPGFPNSFLYGPDACDHASSHPCAPWLLGMAGTFDYVPLPQPIAPVKAPMPAASGW